jgi:hypothetical protein
MRSRAVVKRPTPFVERIASGRCLAGLAVYVSFGTSCRPDTAQTDDAGSTADSAVTSMTSRADDEVKPVYPVDHAPVDPQVQRFCEAVNSVEEARRALCCSERPGLVFTAECARTLGAALRDQAVTLDAHDIDACAAAVARTYAGCDWTGPHPPPLPGACTGVVHGTLPEGAVCRSTLECAGDRHCHGVGPTDPGRCAAPHTGADACGGSVDSLATYTRQDATRTHGECAGYCDRRRCAALAGAGGPCVSDYACASGMRCAAGVCAASLAFDGSPDGAPRATGAACTQDVECTGGCVSVDGGPGRCGPKCGLR